MDLEKTKLEVATHRQNVSALKKRFERNVQLQAATCVEQRAIQNEQHKILRLKRICPSISTSWEDSFVPG